jgi:ribosome-associated translation inhibitor RaiA
MRMKIGGDTLALDADIRHQIEAEAEKFAARFPAGQPDIQVTIREEFDPLHGHRVRCELTARVAPGCQIIVREARKTASDAILDVFTTARRNVRRTRRHSLPSLVTPAACAAPLANC